MSWKSWKPTSSWVECFLLAVVFMEAWKHWWWWCIVITSYEKRVLVLDGTNGTWDSFCGWISKVLFAWLCYPGHGMTLTWHDLFSSSVMPLSELQWSFLMIAIIWITVFILNGCLLMQTMAKWFVGAGDAHYYPTCVTIITNGRATAVAFAVCHEGHSANKDICRVPIFFAVFPRQSTWQIQKFALYFDCMSCAWSAKYLKFFWFCFPNFFCYPYTIRDTSC